MKKGNLLITIIAGFIIITIIMTAVSYIFLSKGDSVDIKSIMEKERIETAVNLANTVAAASVDPLYLEDDFVINEMIKNVVKNSDGLIKYIYVLDADKKVWGDTEKPTNVMKPFKRPGIETLKAEKRKIQKLDDKYFDCGVPILDAGEKIGEVHLGVRYPDIQAEESSVNIVPFIIMLVIGVLGTIIISIIISKLLSNIGAEFITSLKSAKLEELKKQEEEAQKELSQKNKAIKDANAKLEEINNKIKQLGSKYDEVQKVINESDSIVDEKKKQAEFYEKKIEELSEKLKKMKEEGETEKISEADKQTLATLKAQVNNFKSQLQQTISEIEKKRKEEKELAEKIKELKTQVSGIQTSAPITSQDLEKKKKEEIEITQKIVAKRREEIALSQRIELKRKKELELTGRIEMLEKKLKELGQ